MPSSGQASDRHWPRESRPLGAGRQNVWESIVRSRSQRFFTPLLACLLLACIVRFWLLLLTESFWLDETVTAFVIRYGAGHPSLAAGPRLDQTIYYWLPRVSQALFGFSEAALRLPSFAATVVSLFLIGRLAARLIHPRAGWVAVFLCFIPHEFARQATDARPYGLGTCVALACVWLLVRWLDKGAWRDAAFFCLFAALLLRIHLIYWPFYAVLGSYALIRLVRAETPVSGLAIMAVFGIVATSLVPLLPVTLGLFKEARGHVVIGMPSAASLLGAFQLPMIAAGGAGVWLLARAFRWPRERVPITYSDLVLVLGWWLWQPVCLLAFSWITGNSIFVARYFSLALPGMMLVCTLAAAYSIPARAWEPLAAALAFGILIAGSWRGPFPPSRNSHWREAALTVNDLVRSSNMQVVCPSPFVEAQPPVWTPNYPLPGFLYSHLAAYPIKGVPVLLPARRASGAEQFARTSIEESIAPSGRFVLYGGVYGANLWRVWFAGQPELAGWRSRVVGSFGDVEVVLFEEPANRAHANERPPGPIIPD